MGKAKNLKKGLHFLADILRFNDGERFVMKQAREVNIAGIHWRNNKTRG